MALQTPVITVDNVTVPQRDLYNITFRMTVADSNEAFSGINNSQSINVRPGDDVADKVAPAIKAFQKVIDDYQAAVAIQESQSMSDAITAIEGGVTV